MLQTKQQVNFLRDDFKSLGITLPAIQMAQIAGALVIIFVMLSGYQAWSLNKWQQKAHEHQTQRDSLQQQYEHLQEQFVEPTQDAHLVEALKTLNDDIVQKQQLKKFLTAESTKSLFSFSDVLNSLADKDINSIWLTQVKIRTENNQYELHGFTQHSESIPRYIDKLKQAEALQGTSFNVFTIERSKENAKGLLHFTLSNQQQGEANDG